MKNMKRKENIKDIEIWIGSNGGNIVTNEKSKKRRKHKEYINQDK